MCRGMKIRTYIRLVDFFSVCGDDGVFCRHARHFASSARLGVCLAVDEYPASVGAPPLPFYALVVDGGRIAKRYARVRDILFGARSTAQSPARFGVRAVGVIDRG